jgi:hypothetical protein
MALKEKSLRKQVLYTLNCPGLKVKFPPFHLLHNDIVNQYLIISSISELENFDTFIYIKEFIHNKIVCKWFDLQEIENINEREFVPGIKCLIPKAFTLFDLNKKFIK